MQTRAKMINFSILTLLASIIFTLARVLLLFFSFNFETGIFETKGLATGLFLVFTLFILLFFLIKKETGDASPKAFRGIGEDVFSAAGAAIFLALAVAVTREWNDSSSLFYQVRTPVETVTYIIAVPTAFLSSIYYVLRLFAKKISKTFLSIFALAPVLSLAALITQSFAKISASASSLSHYPDILALVMLSFFILAEGREFLPKDASSAKFFPVTSAAFSALFFSVIPDIITLSLSLTLFDFKALVFLLLKLVFLLYTAFEILSMIKGAVKQ